MNEISFWVPGEPKGQPRPRAFARKMGDKFVARVYDAGTAEGWKSQIAIAAKPHLKQLEGALRLNLIFYFPRPKSHLRTNGQRKETAPRSHVTKPDCDNLAKAVMDALSTLGAWHDDRQVTALSVQKHYVDEYAKHPGALIEINTIE